MRHVLLGVLVALSAATPLAAQGITGLAKGRTPSPSTPAHALAQLTAWAVDGRYVLAEAPLIAMVQEPIKLQGLDGLSEAGKLAFKAALLSVEQTIRSVLRSVAAGETDVAEGQARIREAVAEYASRLETLLRQGP